MKKNIKILAMNLTTSNIRNLLILLLILLILSCKIPRKKHKVFYYKTTDKPGYCCKDGNRWYIYYKNPNGTYYYFGKALDFPFYDHSSIIINWSPDESNVSNFSEIPSDVMSETTGESIGGPSDAASEGSSGMSESSGESSGGSDSGGGDSGGGDSGGGDGGGGSD